jgi:hypothetical protein
MDSDRLRTTELIVEFTLFRARVDGRLLDLSQSPWDTCRTRWTANDYSACLELAREARERDVQWIRYWSARQVKGPCGPVFDPSIFSGPELSEQQTWICKVTATSAFMRHEQDSLSVSFESS